MEDNIVSLDALDLLFAEFILSKLDLTKDQIRISFAQKGQISSKIDEDRCYVKFFDEPDERHVWKNRKYDSIDNKLKVTQYTMRTLKLQVIFYGPNADNLSTKLNEIMYFDSSKEFLRTNNLSLIPEKTVQPTIHYERINEQWWHRSDLNLYFYNSISTEDVLDTIESVDFKYSTN